MKKFLSVLLSAIIVFNVAGFSIASAETEIEAGNDISGATEIFFDTEYVSSVDTVEEEDYYKFTTPNLKGFYHITLDSYTGEHKKIYVMNKYGKVIEENTSYSSVGRAATITLELDPNYTYYLKINTANYMGSKSEAGTGSYGICVRYTEDKVGDDFNTAKSISMGQKYEHSLNGPRDLDFFKFVPDRTGTYTITIDNSGISSKWAYMYNESKELVREFSSGFDSMIYDGSNMERKMELQAGKTYYVCVQGFSSSPANAYNYKFGEGNYRYTISVSSEGFGDVLGTEDWAEAVYYMAKANVIKGYDDGLFYPGSQLTRAQAAVIVCRMLGYYDLPATKTAFNDVGSNYDWASGFIAKANSLGIIGGVGNGKYNPAGKLTYAEFTKMLLCMYGHDQRGTGARWWEPYTKYAFSKGLYAGISWWGTNECKLAQSIPLDRARACVLAKNAMEKLK